MKTVTRSKVNLHLWTEPREALGGRSAMDQLYARMEGMYLSRWAREFANKQSVESWTETWAEAFVEEGITPIEIKHGIDRCRTQHEWPPTLPQFLKACRPTIDPELAFIEAVEQMRRRRNPIEENGVMVTYDVWSHPGIYWAAVKMGTDLDNYTYAQIKNRWASVLAKAMNQAKPVPEYRVALPPPSKSVVTPEEGRKRIADLMKTLGMVRRSNEKCEGWEV